jgi:hypothetical protein
MEKIKVDNQPVEALVTFRSMEGKQRAMKAFDIPWYK